MTLFFTKCIFAVRLFLFMLNKNTSWVYMLVSFDNFKKGKNVVNMDTRFDMASLQAIQLGFYLENLLLHQLPFIVGILFASLTSSQLWIRCNNRLVLFSKCLGSA